MEGVLPRCLLAEVCEMCSWSECAIWNELSFLSIYVDKVKMSSQCRNMVFINLQNQDGCGAPSCSTSRRSVKEGPLSVLTASFFDEEVSIRFLMLYRRQSRASSKCT